MTHVGDHGGADEVVELEIVNVLPALHHVRGRIDMRAGVQPHVSAAHQLTQPAVRIILDNLGLELHVLGETFIGPHAKFGGIELKADVDYPGSAAEKNGDIRRLSVILAVRNHLVHDVGPPK